MISLILPTLGIRDKELSRLISSLNNQKFKDFELIIVSQDNHDIVENTLKKAEFSFQQIKIDRKGLSVARNIGIKYIRGDIITFTDDDCWYHEDSLLKVNTYFKESYKEILIFQHIDPITNQYPKKYKTKYKKKLTKMGLLSHASIDIFINCSLVKQYSIGFDEDFGLGAKYNSGEENIYLMDLYNLGYNASYYPVIISFHLNKSRETLYSNDYFITKYKVFERMFGKKKGRVIFLLFILKKKLKTNLSLKEINQGIKISGENTY